MVARGDPGLTEATTVREVVVHEEAVVAELLRNLAVEALD